MSRHGGDFLHRKQEMAGVIYSKHINNDQFMFGYGVGIVFL